MNIYLVGMPGVGKTTLGKKLSKKLNFEFIDTDQLIQKTEQKSIAELLVDESNFRTIESKVIEQLNTSKDKVISLGGGAVLNKKNTENFYGLVIHLNVSLSILKNRIDIETRPLFKKVSLEKMYNDRKSYYENCRDFEVDNTDMDMAVNEIIKIINNPKKKVLVINGPNMNMLGRRDENNYGSKTLNQIEDIIKNYNIFDYTFFQSNIEGEIINAIHTLDNYDALIINPAAYTHTSIAIKDALDIFDKPKIEVHLSDVDNREDYRKVNYITASCDEIFVNKRELSYCDAINYLKKIKNI